MPRWAVARYGGARQGESLSPRSSDVDFDAGTIRFSRALERVRDGSGVFSEPKTSSSPLTLTLPQEAVARLREHEGRHADERAALGEDHRDEGLVF